MKFLVAWGQDVNYRDPRSGQTPFLAAAEKAFPGALMYLYNNSADWQARDSKGRGALLKVMMTNREEYGFQGKPCFTHWVTKKKVHCNIGMRLAATLEILHKIGVDMTEVDQRNFGSTVFHIIIEKDVLEHWPNVTERMTEFGIDVNAREQRHGRSPLHLLIEQIKWVLPSEYPHYELVLNMKENTFHLAIFFFVSKGNRCR